MKEERSKKSFYNPEQLWDDMNAHDDLRFGKDLLKTRQGPHRERFIS